MTGEFKPGNYRTVNKGLRRGEWLVKFFKIWFSASSGEFAIYDVKQVEQEYYFRVDKQSKRKVTPAIWARLKTWQ